MSNTKLSAAQKDDLKALKKYFKGELANNGETTVAYMPLGTTVEFSLAVMSPDEEKFRRKVGEYHALQRFASGETVTMGEHDFHQMVVTVFGIDLY